MMVTTIVRAHGFADMRAAARVLAHTHCLTCMTLPLAAAMPAFTDMNVAMPI